MSTPSTDILNRIALVVYEYLVTLSNEVQLFWRKEITGASV